MFFVKIIILIFSIILFFINTLISVNSLQLKILHTSILNFLPQLKLHHVALLSNSFTNLTNINYNNVYAIDFSPINQSDPITLTKLLFAFNVPGEIRIRKLNLNLNKNYNDDELINIWYDKNIKNYCYIQSQNFTDYTFNNIDDNDIKNIIIDIKKWNLFMNLYFHNCQHFSSFIKKLIYKN